MTKWMIYYGDGTVFRDCDGNPEDAPKRNVQVILQEDKDCGRVMLNTKDYYWWRPDYGDWMAGEIFGLFDYFIEPGFKVILFGRTIGNIEFENIIKVASNSEYLPMKSARRSWERKA